MKNEIIYYETLVGNCPVEEFLNDLPVKHRAKTFRNLELVQDFGHQLGGKMIDHIQGDVWELRTSFGNNISRILYFLPVGNTIVLLHGFVKKTQKTPTREINKALHRMKDYKNRY